MTHDLGDVTPEALVAEAKTALSLYRAGTQQLLDACYSEAMDSFFKAAAIAVNVTFTARTHGMVVPDALYEKMDLLVARATKGIKKVMKAVAMKKVLKHETLFHESPAGMVQESSSSMGEAASQMTFIPGVDRIRLFHRIVGANVPEAAVKVVPGGVLVENRYMPTFKAASRPEGWV